MSAPYQLMPPLSHIEMAELRASIEAHGVQVPVIVDEHGAVIDGHHRQKLAAELGIECPLEVREGLSEDEKRMLALTLNTKRRMLTREQVREVIAQALHIAPERSDRQVAKDLNVDRRTVASVRNEPAHDVPVVEKRIGADGRTRKQPAKPKPGASKPATTPKPAKLKAPPPVVERVMPPVEVRDSLRAFHASFETHRKELEGVFASEIDKLSRYAKDPYAVTNVKRIIDRIRRALDTFKSSVGGAS